MKYFINAKWSCYWNSFALFNNCSLLHCQWKIWHCVYHRNISYENCLSDSFICETTKEQQICCMECECNIKFVYYHLWMSAIIPSLVFQINWFTHSFGCYSQRSRKFTQNGITSTIDNWYSAFKWIFVRIYYYYYYSKLSMYGSVAPAHIHMYKL